MEEHRLQELPPDYNPQLFTKLFKELTPLKKKLAANFDFTRFKGITYEDLLSFYDVKFILLYKKYFCEKHLPENLLRGHLISGLSNYRNRLLKMSYQEKYLTKAINPEGIDNFDNLLKDEASRDSREMYFSLLYTYIQQKLNNPIAYDLFHVELYIPEALKEYVVVVGRKKIIPTWVLVEYLDIPHQVGIDMNVYLDKCRARVKEVLVEAQKYFKYYEMPL